MITRRRPCKVCRLPASERDLIEGATLAGWSPRSIAARVKSIKRGDVTQHMAHYVVGSARGDDRET